MGRKRDGADNIQNKLCVCVCVCVCVRVCVYEWDDI